MLIFRSIRKRRNTRLICAVAFLFLLFCEVSSHAYLDAHERDHTLPGVETGHNDFADPHCAILTACDEEPRPDGQLPNLMDEAAHHDVLVSNHSVSFIRASRLSERSLPVRMRVASRADIPLSPPPKS
jgi:hypothetical protein